MNFLKKKWIGLSVGIPSLLSKSDLSSKWVSNSAQWPTPTETGIFDITWQIYGLEPAVHECWGAAVPSHFHWLWGFICISLPGAKSLGAKRYSNNISFFKNHRRHENTSALRCSWVKENNKSHLSIKYILDFVLETTVSGLEHEHESLSISRRSQTPKVRRICWDS